MDEDVLIKFVADRKVGVSSLIITMHNGENIL